MADDTEDLVDEAADLLQELLETIVDAADLDLDVEVDEDGSGGLIGEFVGDDVARLIGHHGQTIDAIQHLAYRIAGGVGETRVPILVDADGYRGRREVTLRQTADEAAATALREDRPVPLDAMSALERKVIHEHLKDRADLETYSRGQEPSRHLVVAPVHDD